MSVNEKAIMTVLCMIYDGNKILLQDRVKKDWRGLTFPGGHVEKEESFVKAVIREMKEETGLLIHNPQICGVKQFQTDSDERYVVLLFKTNQFEGELCSSDEGEMVWIDRTELFTKPLVKDFFDLLKVFDDINLNEFKYDENHENNTWTIGLY